MMIKCTDLYGNDVEIDEAYVKPSTRVYGVVTRKNNGVDELLVITIKSTGKFYLPGGGIDPGESDETALEREFLEEVGLKVTVKEKLPVEGCINFHHNTYKETWVATVRFYSCASDFDLNSDHVPDDLEAIDPAWVPVSRLSANSFQKGIGEHIMKALECHQSNHSSF